MYKLLLIIALPLFLIATTGNYAKAAPAGSIDGTVYYDTAKTNPLGGVDVTIYKPHTSSFISKRTITDANGKFSFTGLTAKDYYELSFQKANYNQNNLKQYFAKTGDTMTATLLPNTKK